MKRCLKMLLLSAAAFAMTMTVQMKDVKADLIDYVDEKGIGHTQECTQITESSSTGFETGWYYVTGNVSISDKLVIVKDNADVKLILCDNAVFTVTGSSTTADNAGIDVGDEESLTIYGQSGQSGKLIATGGAGGSTYGGGAGIGGGHREDGGTVIINGGIIEATGGAGGSTCGGGAGIGGGANKSGGTVIINAGDVKATGGDGGDSQLGAAGIGGGASAGGSGGGGSVTINGGAVEAYGGGMGAAGIGAGAGRTTGEVTISGGEVEANGGAGAAGIGAGAGQNGGNITISGGVVKATGGEDYVFESVSMGGGAGIGGGAAGNGGVVVISGGEVKAEGNAGGAGIGGGKHSSTYGGGNGGDVTITGGTVMAGGSDNAAGIGAGDGGTDQSSLIAGDNIVIKAGDDYPPTDVKEHGTGGVIVLSGEKYYITAGIDPVPPTNDDPVKVSGNTVYRVIIGVSGDDYICYRQGSTSKEREYIDYDAEEFNLTQEEAGKHYLTLTRGENSRFLQGWICHSLKGYLQDLALQDTEERTVVFDNLDTTYEVHLVSSEEFQILWNK